MADADYVSTTEAAEILQVSRGTVQRWVREGYLKVWRGPAPGGWMRIPRSEVERVRALGDGAA